MRSQPSPWLSQSTPGRLVGLLNQLQGPLDSRTASTHAAEGEGIGQGEMHLAGRLVAGIGACFECAVDDGCDRVGQLGGDVRDGDDVSLEHEAQRVELTAAGGLAGVAAGEHDVEGGAGGPDIADGARVAEADELLTRHVEGVAAAHTGSGEAVELGGNEALGEAEVADLADGGAVGTGEEEVGGLDVAVDEAGGVGGGEAREDIEHDGG